jgi:hypothetical protein
MFAATHKLIASKVYEEVEFQYGFMLDSRSFLFGSIAPDLYPSMLLMDHDTTGSIGLVHEYIDILSNGNLPETQKEVREFSFRLGVVIHFVSDYFCRAHNDKRYKNMLLHFIYEGKLNSLFKRSINTEKYYGVEYPETYGDAKHYIEEAHQQYILREENMVDDLVYSVGVSTAVAEMVAACCMANARTGLFVRKFKQNFETA